MPDEELVRVAQLYENYGWCGLLYWVSQRHGGIRSEFTDVNRKLEFVEHEEAIARELVDSSKLAYTERIYTITGKGA